MRVILGMILGAVLTVLGAYLYDSRVPATAEQEPGVEHRTMVNWDVVDANWRAVKTQARQQWVRLSDNINQ